MLQSFETYLNRLFKVHYSLHNGLWNCYSLQMVFGTALREMLYILYKMFLRKILSYQENKGQNHQAEIFFDKKHQFKIKNINLGNIIGKKKSTFTVCLFLPPKRTQNQQHWNSGKTLEWDKTMLLSIESLLKNSYPATNNLIIFSKSFTLHFLLTIS